MPQFKVGDRIRLLGVGYGIRSRHIGTCGEIQVDTGREILDGHLYYVLLDTNYRFVIPESYMELESLIQLTNSEKVLNKINKMWERQNYVKLRRTQAMPELW